MEKSDNVIEKAKMIKRYLGFICILGMLVVINLYEFDFLNIGTRNPRLYLVIIGIGIAITKAKKWFLIFADIYLLLLISLYFFNVIYPDFAHHYLNWILY